MQSHSRKLKNKGTVHSNAAAKCGLAGGPGTYLRPSLLHVHPTCTRLHPTCTQVHPRLPTCPKHAVLPDMPNPCLRCGSIKPGAAPMLLR